MSIELIAGPTAEPITLNDAKLQLGFGPMQDSDRAASQILNDKLRFYITLARQDCENWCKRVFITQRWLLRLDGFAGVDWRYVWKGRPALPLPKPPFQSMDFVYYVDTTGTVQTLPLDTTYGNSGIQYAYQLARGSETQPGIVFTDWARPWPPIRMVPSNVMMQFRCGYGGPIVASMTEGSALLTLGGGVAFNFDDAPLMAGNTGTPISVTGAGPGGGALNTFIASVNPANGQATLKDVAVATVANVPGWAGQAIPAVIIGAIRAQVQIYYENSGSAPPIEVGSEVANFLLPYMHYVS